MKQPDSLLFSRIALALRAGLPLRENGGHVVLVTSASGGEGKSFVSRLLLHELTQATPGEIALRNTASSPDGAGTIGQPLFVRAEAGVNDALLFQPARVARALEGLRQRFSITLIDGPVLSNCGALLRAVDAVLLVVDSRATSPQAVRRAMTLASIDASDVHAAVLNKAPRGVPAWLGAD